MPIKIPNQLPATSVLTSENIFVMTETRAITQADLNAGFRKEMEKAIQI